MMGRWMRRLALAGMSLALGLGGLAAQAQEAPGLCHIGAYELADGRIVDMGRTTGGLRWRTFDGLTGALAPDGAGWASTAGWTERPDGLRVSFGPCDAGTLRFGDVPGRRIALEVRETEFVSGDVKLKGRLVMPTGQDPVAVVVLLQGSEFHSARDFDPLQRLLPAAGVGAFVYDKRGVGASGGAYTQDFSRLADDAVAALAEARRMAGARATRIGFQGPSQGGWVAPIAASRTPADFVIVSFGLAVSVFDEDQEAIAFQMGLKGYDPATIRKAQEIGAAAGAVFESGFTDGFDAFEAVRAKYRAEPWFTDVYGNFTHILLSMSPEDLRSAGKKFRWGTPMRYDPMPTLTALRTPQLWIVGGQDIDAPSGETARRLNSLIDKGRPITLAVYPGAEHGMTEFELGADGERLSTRYSADYFRLMRDFARDGRIAGPYGGARIRRPLDLP